MLRTRSPPIRLHFAIQFVVEVDEGAIESPREKTAPSNEKDNNMKTICCSIIAIAATALVAAMASQEN